MCSQVPTDVDIRVMLTFLELYQTLLSFVFFKLYTDSGFVYPPPLDAKKDEGAAGLAALSLQSIARTVPQPTTVPVANGRQITGKDVRKTIKSITTDSAIDVSETQVPQPEHNSNEPEEEFVVHASKSDPSATTLPTLQSLSSLPITLSTNLFSAYTFFLSREISRPIFEFIIKCFGGRVGWPASSGGGSPFTESDSSITHFIIDRPVVEKEESAKQRELHLRRKYVQPQWVVDCINAGKILLEDNYAQGKPLPPHLSPFGEYEGAYVPQQEEGDVSMSAEQEEADEDDAMEQDETPDQDIGAALSAEVETTALLRAAELAAEAAGVDSTTFEARVEQLKKKQPSKSDKTKADDNEEDMNKMMMSNKQRKLYEKVNHGHKKRESEVIVFFSLFHKSSISSAR